MTRFKDKITTRVSKCIEELELNVNDFKDKENQYVNFMAKLIADHHKNVVEGEVRDVYTMALDLYKTHLQEIEVRDVNTLKKQLQDMKRMKMEILEDLDKEETLERDMVSDHEELWMSVTPQITTLRRNCVFLAQQIEEMKNDFKVLDGDGGSGEVPDKNNEDRKS